MDDSDIKSKRMRKDLPSDLEASELMCRNLASLCPKTLRNLQESALQQNKDGGILNEKEAVDIARPIVDSFLRRSDKQRDLEAPKKKKNAPPSGRLSSGDVSSVLDHERKSYSAIEQRLNELGFAKVEKFGGLMADRVFAIRDDQKPLYQRDLLIAFVAFPLLLSIEFRMHHVEPNFYKDGKTHDFLLDQIQVDFFAELGIEPTPAAAAQIPWSPMYHQLPANRPSEAIGSQRSVAIVEIGQAAKQIYKIAQLEIRIAFYRAYQAAHHDTQVVPLATAVDIAALESGQVGLVSFLCAHDGDTSKQFHDNNAECKDRFPNFCQFSVEGVSQDPRPTVCWVRDPGNMLARAVSVSHRRVEHLREVIKLERWCPPLAA